MKKLFITLGSAAALTAIITIAGMANARAATEQVLFGSDGTLNVSGTCTGRFAIVIIRNSSDGSIWGSSNPDCVNGSYKYSIKVPDADRQGGTYKVQVSDAATADGSAPTSTAANEQPIVFAPAPVTTEISNVVIDTSTTATTTDESFLDDTLQKFFTVVMDVGDAVQQFTTIFANTVKASLVATVNLFTKNLTLLPGGSITVPTGANEISGSDWLSAGMTDVFIPNTSVTTSSKIILTPQSLISSPIAVTNKQPGVGFHVTVATPQAQAVQFDWLIVQTYGAEAPAQAQNFSAGVSNNVSNGGGGDSGGAIIVNATGDAAASDTVSTDDASTTIGASATTDSTSTTDTSADANSTIDATSTTDTSDAVSSDTTPAASTDNANSSSDTTPTTSN